MSRIAKALEAYNAAARAQSPGVTVAVITDAPQLASAMRKWLYGHTNEHEQSALLAAGYLKLIPGGHGALGATAKGWHEAQNPKRVSEDAHLYAPDDDPRGGTLPTGTDVIALCPECNGTDIREKNIAYADLPVTRWEVDGAGNPAPMAFDTDVSADWYSDSDPKPYVCRTGGGCEWEGNLHELMYRARTEDDE